MQFLYPTFLYALAALAIPIIIHLFYFRRFKKVYFTNVKFLKEVKDESSARRKLRNLLVLLARCFAVASLVFAFAQPFIPQNTEVKAGRKAVSVYVDNSFSMTAASQDVPLLEKAKRRAREIIEAFPVDDRFQVLTSDFEGRHQRLVGKEEALTLVDEIKISPAVKEISKVLNRQQQALNTGNLDNKVAYLISDFQKNITDADTWQDTTIDVNFVPLQAVQENNIAIDSAWFEAPVPMLNQPNPLVVQVHNYGTEDAETVRLSVRYNNQVKPVGTLAVPAGQTVVDTVNLSILKPGWQEAVLEITDFPVQFDDKYYLAFNVSERINTLVIHPGQPNKYLTAALRSIPNFAAEALGSQQLDYSKLPDYQLIVLENLTSISTGLSFELKNYVENGGNLLIFPGVNANIQSYQSFLAGVGANELRAYEQQDREVGTINTSEFIFNQVYENRSANLKLPATKANFKLTQYGARQEEALLTYRDGNTFLGKYRLGQGHIYLCAAPLVEEVNNLMRSGEIFVPMLYKMAISAGQSQPIAYTISRDEVLEVSNTQASAENVYKIRGNQEEFIPEQRIVARKAFLGVNNQIPEAGFYNLYLNDETSLATFAFNFDRKESNLGVLRESELEALTGDNINVISSTANADFTVKIAEQNQGVTLWRWFLIAALVFLLIEVLLLRFIKV